MEGGTMNEEQLREIKRHFEVVAEHLSKDIVAVAEGHETIRREAAEFRREMREEFKEVKSLIRFSYAELDRRIQRLEEDAVRVENRLDQLERALNGR